MADSEGCKRTAHAAAGTNGVWLHAIARAHAVRMRQHAQVELGHARALRDDAVCMRQQAQMDLGRARTLCLHSIRMHLQAKAELAHAQAYNTDDGKDDKNGVHDAAVDAGREGSVVEPAIMDESLAAGGDHFADTDSVRYVTLTG
ncbi:hypothetical protein E2562_013648 [Oryza meyeriana var. granulata]|uniref:Uncharacterized protein n=1 Tax=Oryza meyeriana var. granulata TaxID=110450 RepID=A0A6G1BK11_9ORYZ|nr:hypothetical protein E2562_013648 [Oryza meyeriana var. granulata]